MKYLKKIIPSKFHYQLSNLKNALTDGYARKHYSQFGEDIILGKILPQQKGFYIDVGAHNPTRYSNTAILSQRGWRGINIDANPHSISLFKRARPDDINLCVGVGAEEKSLEYYQFSDPAVNTFSMEEAEKWKGKSWISYRGSKKIKVQPLRTILRSLKSLPPIDLLSIDVEGMDYDVLVSNDWNAYRPQVVLIESHGFSLEHPEKDKSYRLLKEKGYTLVARTGPSLIFQSSVPSVR